MNISDSDLHFFSTSIVAGMLCNYNFFRWKLVSMNWCEARHWSLEENAEHQEMGDKTVRTGGRGFMYFSTSSYSLRVVTTARPFASLSQNPHNRACNKQDVQEWRKRRGRLGKAFTCCIVAVHRACSAAFLNLCISPCTSLSPFAFCSPSCSCPPAPLPVLPSRGHSARHRPSGHRSLEVSRWWSQACRKNRRSKSMEER